MKITIKIGALLLSSLFISCVTPSLTTQNEVEEYKAEWSSLAQHRMPQWLLDAKIGIYAHWGPQTYYKSQPLGSIEIMDCFDGWTGENFDAAEWARVFKSCGAQFAGPVAQHGNGCLNWDSEITDWNSTNHGPKRDIVGELEPEIKKLGMKFMASFHLVAPTAIWGQISKDDRTYNQPVPYGIPTDRSDTRWMQGWVDRLDEVTTKYGIDMIWFDSSLGQTIHGELDGYVDEAKYIPDGTEKTRIGGLGEAAQQQIIANFYNYGLRENKDVEVVYKARDIPRNVGMRTFERGNTYGQQYDPWMTDLSLHYPPKKTGEWNEEAWFYTDRNILIETSYIIDVLIDIVSKNGRILLNIPPKIDGTFPEDAVQTLHEIGDWLKINGEGIYGSSPWCIYGEGPGAFTRQGHFALVWGTGLINPFTSEDVRYTTKGRNIYAFALDKPEGNTVYFRALGSYNKLYPGEVKDVELLGYDGDIQWDHQQDALVVTMPEDVDDSYAYCFKIVR